MLKIREHWNQEKITDDENFVFDFLKDSSSRSQKKNPHNLALS